MSNTDVGIVFRETNDYRTAMSSLFAVVQFASFRMQNVGKNEKKGKKKIKAELIRECLLSANPEIMKKLNELLNEKGD
jgi:hypothetical protein